MLKDSWLKKIGIMTGLIVGVGASSVYVSNFVLWSKERNAKSVIQCREKYFVVDHKPLYDSVTTISSNVSKNIVRDSILELLNYKIDEVLTNDEKISATNKFNTARSYRIK